MALTKVTADVLDGSLGADWQASIKTANFTAEAGKGYLIDSSSSTVTITLPSNPAIGNKISVIDYSSSAGVNDIILSSTNNIEGSSGNKKISYDKASVNLVYLDSTKGWLVESAANESSSALTESYSSGVEAYNAGNTTDGFYNIKLPSWSAAKSVYCDMTNDGGGWMLWGQRVSSSPTLDIRYTGTLSGYTADATKGYLNEMTDLSQSGFIDLWPYFDGTKQIRWYNNISGNTATSPGTFSTKVLIAGENGTSINNANYWNWYVAGTCVSAATHRYDFDKDYTDAGWINNHNSGNNACTGWGFEAASNNNMISNFQSGADCGSCWHAVNRLFGNGASGYYSYGNTYDDDHLAFDLASDFRDVSITNHDANSNQLWVK
jgi:hypothetical protein